MALPRLLSGFGAETVPLALEKQILRCSGVRVSGWQRLREREAENAKLKRISADLARENTAVTDILNRKS